MYNFNEWATRMIGRFIAARVLFLAPFPWNLMRRSHSRTGLFDCGLRKTHEINKKKQKKQKKDGSDGSISLAAAAVVLANLAAIQARPIRTRSRTGVQGKALGAAEKGPFLFCFFFGGGSLCVCVLSVFAVHRIPSEHVAVMAAVDEKRQKNQN